MYVYDSSSAIIVAGEEAVFLYYVSTLYISKNVKECEKCKRCLHKINQIDKFKNLKIFLANFKEIKKNLKRYKRNLNEDHSKNTKTKIILILKDI